MDNCLLAGRYRLLEPLGRGGMGQVRRAWDSSLGRPVAVKLLELDEADPAAAERFRREAQTTARLSHPNIVTVFDTGTDGSTAFLVMELLPGPSLQDRLTREGPLPVAEAAAVGAQAAAALADAHAAGVVHRDIKPANIAYDGHGQVKVLDFGIARLIESTTAVARLTQTATVIGTAAYLSPEQASGAPAGPQADLYALGCVLFALLTGTPPFTGGTPVQICSQHLHAPPPDLAARCPSCPPQLAQLVTELLAKDPAARPAGAAAVRDQLAACPAAAAATLAPEPPQTAGPPPYPTKVLTAPAKLADRLRSPRRRQLVTAAAAAAAVLAAVLAIVLTGGTQTGHTPGTVRAPQKQRTRPSPAATPGRTAQWPQPSPRETGGQPPAHHHRPAPAGRAPGPPGQRKAGHHHGGDHLRRRMTTRWTGCGQRKERARPLGRTGGPANRRSAWAP